MERDHVIIAVLLAVTIVAVFAIRGSDALSGASVVELGGVKVLSESLPAATSSTAARIPENQVMQDQQTLLRMLSFGALFLIGTVIVLTNYLLKHHNPKI